MPVIGCAACLTPKDEKDYFFSGVCRSKTVRGPGTPRRANDKFMRLRLTFFPLARRRWHWPDG